SFAGIVGSYTGTVTFSSSDVQAGLPASYTFTSADAGTHTFSVSLKTAGSQSITVTDTAAPAQTGSATGIVVTPAAAASFDVAGSPATTAGVASSFTVTARDAFGNVATGYPGTVHLSSSDPATLLSPDAALVNGVGTFQV